MTTWTVETVQALAEDLRYRTLAFCGGDAELAKETMWGKYDSALTWALERIYLLFTNSEAMASLAKEACDRAEKAEAERDAANARADEAYDRGYGLGIKYGFMRGVNGAPEAEIHAIADRYIDSARALKTYEASK